MLKIFRFITIVLVGVTLVGSGCASPESPANSSNVSKNLKGVSLSPKSFSSTDFTDFFVKAKQAGDAVSWAGDWNEFEDTNKGGPAVIASLASTYDYTPIVEAQFFTQSSGSLLRPLDEETKQKYKTDAVTFAKKYKPQYFGLGIEVNVLYEKSPSDFENFVQFYNEVYDAVKAESPDTKIFTVFQLEKMKGLGGGLFGGENNPEKNEWQLLDQFKSDIAAFTTYPSLIYKTPSEIPENYYDEIKTHTKKPIAFTEIGWPSAAAATGWESSEALQAEFITRFFSLTENLSAELTIWSFLYDQSTGEPFNSMGLLKKNGTAKTAWDIWLSQ